MSDYSTVYKEQYTPPRGFTPFQFSSKKMQVNTTQLGGLIPDNPISSLLIEATAWYEMWINPEKVDIKRQYQQRPVHTAGAIVTFHYRPDTLKLSVSGVVGWIAINPQEEQNPLIASLSNASPQVKDDIGKNSPRVFLQRLRDIADEPMYFIDLKGVEHYNIKYIKLYTKQYPNGVVCEGYFTSFNVPEEGSDVQTVKYDFEFTIESLKPMTFFQKMAGMYGAKGNVIGSTIRGVPGLS